MVYLGLTGPSENLYRHLGRYDIDLLGDLRAGRGVHPYFQSLLKTNFNIKEFPEKIQEISTSRGRLRNPMSAENANVRMNRILTIGDRNLGTERFVNYLGFDPTTDAGKVKTILTWDTETTGITAESRLRTISLVKRNVTLNPDGTTTIVNAPEVVMTKQFRAVQADIAHIFESAVDHDGNPIKRAISLSERNVKI